MAHRYLGLLLLCFYPATFAQNRILFAADPSRLPLVAAISALGDAGAARKDRFADAYWNPAAAAFPQQPQIQVEAAALYQAQSMQGVIAGGSPVAERLNVAALYVPFYTGDIPLYGPLGSSYEENIANHALRPNGQPTSFFSYNTHHVLLSIASLFAVPFPRPAGFSFPLPVYAGFGVNIKTMAQTLDPGGTTRTGLNINLDGGFILTIGVDYDIQNQKPSRELAMGASFRNLLPTEVLWLESPTGYTEPVDVSQAYGFWYRDDKGFGFFTWQAGAEFHREAVGYRIGEGLDHRVSYHYGLQGTFFSRVDFRAGLSDRQLTFGAGLRWRDLQLDYAFRFDAIDISPARVSIGYQF